MVVALKPPLNGVAFDGKKHEASKRKNEANPATWSTFLYFVFPTNEMVSHTGVLLKLVLINIDGTGFDGVCSIYQGQKATHGLWLVG